MCVIIVCTVANRCIRRYPHELEEQPRSPIIWSSFRPTGAAARRFGIAAPGRDAGLDVAGYVKALPFGHCCFGKSRSIFDVCYQIKQQLI
jgi:hypothetical protein